MQPIGEEHCWKDLNFYENDFTDELGSLLTDSKNVDVDANYSKFSPASSLNGEMKKKWVIENGIRYLMKVNANDYGQQSINEVIASKLHEKLGWDNYVQYRVDTAIVDGEKVPSSLCQLFTSNELELVSAYQLIKDIKIPNDSSEFEEIIRQAVNYGMEEAVVRQQLEYTILTDFIPSNTDRHYNNFGFLYHLQLHRLVKMAPVFDTGNSLFYNKEIIPQGSNLLDVTVNSFKKKEVSLLEYVSKSDLVGIGKLESFPKEVYNLLTYNTDMPDERAKSISGTVQQKLEYLKLFQQGKKIWKKENRFLIRQLRIITIKHAGW